MKIIYDNVPKEIIKSLQYDQAKQRFMFYTDKLDKINFIQANYIDEPHRLCYSESIVQLKMGTKLYLKRSNKKGFTFDKQTSKLTMWFGSGVNKLSKLDLFMRAIGKEWVPNENLTDWCTKTLLEKILSGTITNPKQACKFIVQQSRLEASPEKLRQYIKSGGVKYHLLYIKDVYSNLDSFLVGEHSLSYNEDIVLQAKALGKKIDPTWSINRTAQVHADWTNELMAMEIEDIKDVKVRWPKLKLPSNFKLINSRKLLFEEGAKMHHCVYTNYWEKVRSKKYMVLHITDAKGNEATAGLHVNGEVKLDNVLSKYNKPASLDIKAAVNKLLKNQPFIDSVLTSVKKTKQLSYAMAD